MGKKQHYVPRVLTKGFSDKENEKLINIFLISTRTVKEGKGRYDQSQKHNLYGADQELEGAFEILETNTSPALDKLRSGNLQLTPQELGFLLCFVVFQRNRTPQQAKQFEESFNLMVKNLASHDSKLKNHLDDFTVGLNDPYRLLFQMSVSMVENLADLRLGLLQAPSGEQFVLSEHPVVVVNPFLHLKNWPASKQGPGVKGAAIVLPISSEYAVLLYDPLRYKFFSQSGVATLSVADLTELNKCQFLQTEDCIYFSGSISQNHLTKLAEETKVYRNCTKATLQVYPANVNKKGKGRRSELIQIGSEALPISQNFDFLGIRRAEWEKPLGNTMDVSREAVKNNELRRERDRRDEAG